MEWGTFFLGAVVGWVIGLVMGVKGWGKSE